MKYIVVDSSNPVDYPLYKTTSLADAKKFAKKWNKENCSDDLEEAVYECLITVTY